MLRQFFFVPVNPEPWAVGPLGISNRGGTKRPFIGPNDQLVNYQKAVQGHLAKYQMPQLSSDCELNFYFWRRLDGYETPSGRRHARHFADATNLQKGLEDALQGILINNDRQVRRITSEIVEQSSQTVPGIIIALRSAYRSRVETELGDDLMEKFNEVRKEADSIDLSDNRI